MLLGPLFAVMAIGSVPADFHPFDLRCEYLVNPLALDTAKPRLSWKIESERRGWRQGAYQLVVTESPGKKRLWDSGKVASAQSLGVEYAGEPLRSRQAASWKVRVWDSEGNASPWSAPARFETGLLRQEDWGAEWISARMGERLRPEDYYRDRPMPLFRKAFRIEKPIRQARAYVSGLGYYELRLNGKKIGDHLLDPAWTDYSKRVLYSAFDVTKLLREGENAAGIMLGSGWWDPLPLPLFGRWNLRKELAVGDPRAILRLDIDYRDGSHDSVVTDQRWKTAEGPIVRNSIYLGETYDARRERPGWDGPGFDDKDWSGVSPAVGTVGPIHAQMIPPIRATRTVPAQKVTEPKPGAYVFDLGQNFAGFVRLKTRGPAGTTVKMRLGELLHPDGTVNVFTSCMTQIKKGAIRIAGFPQESAEQSETYVLRGDGVEEYTPRFTFHGFRYVEVTGLAEKPTLATIAGLRLNSDVASAGSFECSNPMLNKLQEVVRWTQLSNMFSVQSDCPHREKLGYGGDIVAASEMAMLNFDMSRFYAKAVVDFADAARPNGGFTETAPFVGIADEGLGDGSGPIGWGTALPELSWQLRQYYGDTRTLEEQYAAVKKYVALLKSKAVDGILDNGISDHESLVPKPRPLTGTAFYFHNADLAAKMARALGRDSEASEYSSLAESIRAAFVKKFFDPATGKLFTGTQACQAFGLYFALVPEGARKSVLEGLLKDIEEHKGHLTTGIFGTKYMLNALTEYGRADVAYAMATTKEFPGWGYMLENGATTLWETWKKEEFIYSHNHPMFGSVSEWMFKAIGGIRPYGATVGFDQIMIEPQMVGDLKWAKTSYQSVRGLIETDWKIEGPEFVLKVRIPANCSAYVRFKTSDPKSVVEGGGPAANALGIVQILADNGLAMYKVGSGQYTFRARR